MSNFPNQYKGLFSSNTQAQGAINSGGMGVNDVYWRDSNNQPFMVPTTAVPGWAQTSSDATRNMNPGQEMGAKSESMLDYLKAVAEGRRSATMEQADIASKRAEAQAQSQLKSNPWSTASQRAAGYAAGNAGMDINAQAAIGAQQEKQAAQQAYLDAATNQRKQDTAALLAMEELARRYRELGMSDEQARAAALQQYAKDMVSRYGLEAEGTAMWNEKDAMNQAAIFGTLGTVAGTAAGAMVGGPVGAAAGGAVGGSLGKGIGSDKNRKDNIKDASQDVKEFLDAISAKSWNWKDTGKHDLGIIAQDLEKSKIGKSLMEPVDGMKGYTADPHRFNPTVLASLAEMNNRINKLEKK